MAPKDDLEFGVDMLVFFLTYLLSDTRGYVYEARSNVDTEVFTVGTLHRMMGKRTASCRDEAV